MAFDFDVIIIGSGFGATVLALDQSDKGKSVLILERGVWWLTPELSAENPMSPYLKARPKTQPVQYWPRPDHRGGVIDLLSVVKATGALGGLQGFANGIADFFSGGSVRNRSTATTRSTKPMCSPPAASVVDRWCIPTSRSSPSWIRRPTSIRPWQIGPDRRL